MEALIEMLRGSMQEQRRVTIVHGDFRLENVMFHPTQPRIIGVLDWEISTIGDPRADVGYCCLLYHWTGVGNQAFDLKGLAVFVCVFRFLIFVGEGVPSEEDFVARYCSLTGQGAHGIENFGWHVAFSFFRLAAIAAGVYKRALQVLPVSFLFAWTLI
jgi:aminoglycoside phosphotransferase (APT) family kinase protein